MHFKTRNQGPFAPEPYQWTYGWYTRQAEHQTLESMRKDLQASCTNNKVKEADIRKKAVNIAVQVKKATGLLKMGKSMVSK
jgi:hypothetical protein